MVNALRNNWPEYLIEAWCLGTFMVSACFLGTALFNPASPMAGYSFEARTIVMGVAMGTTAIAIICSPWGKRSGAHFNPAVTITFLRLGKIRVADAVFYVVAHFAGGAAGVLVSWLVLGSWLSDSMVIFVATRPGSYGTGVALAAEAVISFLMMSTILFSSNSQRLSNLTPFLAGSMLAIFISLESNISGTSMNPARTFASAAVSGDWNGSWIYFIAPPAAMLAAAEVFVRLRGLKAVMCAKLHHNNPFRCIFNCGYHMEAPSAIEVTRNPRLFPTIAGLL
jgi:aquaporin Z